ncbi:hypothetical protein [Rhodobacter sp. NSM]|uniref:hypothetical protein n=1 Tax=Rhodobacter sp. NSM TaxID=3457501 RepID=UPI003FCF93FF
MAAKHSNEGLTEAGLAWAKRRAISSGGGLAKLFERGADGGHLVGELLRKGGAGCAVGSSEGELGLFGLGRGGCTGRVLIVGAEPVDEALRLLGGKRLKRFVWILHRK